MSGSREYTAWVGMKTRCMNKNVPSYKHYGGRGIIVCDRWADSFESFYLDMGKCPDGYSIERIEVNGSYEPSNCKWIPILEQAKNRRSGISHNGESPLEVAERTGLKVGTVYYRLRNGVDVNKPLMARRSA